MPLEGPDAKLSVRSPAPVGLHRVCAPPKPTWIDFRGTLIASKKGTAGGNVNSLVVNNKTITKAMYETETFDWKAHMDPAATRTNARFALPTGLRRQRRSARAGASGRR